MRMEEKLMDKIQQIIQGIAAAMANSYDGATDENGDPIKIGLRREEGDPVLDSRVMDGFGCKIQGDLLVVKYSTEENLKGLRGILQPRPQVVHHCRGVGAALLVVAPVSALAAQLLQTEKERTKGGRCQLILPPILPLILPPHLQVLYRPIQAGDVLLDDQREVLNLSLIHI